MKKIFLALSAMIGTVYAQSNTFPSTGNAGIGTTSPLSGGVAASWITLSGNTTYGGGLISSIAGTAKGFYYYDGSTGSLAVQGTSGVDVTLQPNGATTLIAKANGNVGIGTMDPTIAKLEVNGLIASDVTGNNQYSLNSSGANYGFLLNNAANIWSLGYGITPSTIGTSVLTWNSSGNVGIGVTSPSTPLQVNGTIYSATPISNSAVIGTTQAGNLNYNFIGYDGYWGLRTATNNSYNVDVYNGGTPITAMTVLQNGSVGVGTTDPKGYKLAVAGNAIAESMTVKLQANWPDYVFKKDYSLAPLSEIKTYIDKNQHLPGVPTAEEVSKKGINLGEMNALLMKKVEELTLYLIEKDKQDKEKDAKLQSQQKQIDELKQQITGIMATQQQKNTKAK